MSEENKNSNKIAEDQINKTINEDKNITIKKSTYNNLLKGVIAAIAIATFLGGYAIGTLDDNSNFWCWNSFH